MQLALQTPEETRARTGDLNVGFDEETRTWGTDYQVSWKSGGIRRRLESFLNR